VVPPPDDDGVGALYLIRLLPVVFSAAAAIAYVFHVEGGNAYAIRNTGPIIIVILLALITLWRGSGHWTGSGWSWLLGTCGFAIPALGLSIYLHYGYASDLNGMYSEAIYPKELFRFLPLYTIVAGTIGFAIGWIVGRNV
jgi:hypothetical protein